MAYHEERIDPEVLQAAVNDGINRYVRDVLVLRSLVHQQEYDSHGRELDRQRWGICSAVAHQWSACRKDTDA